MSRGLFETVKQEMRLRGYRPRTIKVYTKALRRFVVHFRPCHPRKLQLLRIVLF
jgi:hypothetical protein